MDYIFKKYNEWSALYDLAWENRDKRVDGWFLLDSPVPTILICLTYVYLVKVSIVRCFRKQRPALCQNRLKIQFSFL